YCYDFAGNLIWKKDLGAFPMSGGWGTASSPVLDGKRLFVLCDNEQESFLVALDALTGDELWRVARSESTSYASPFVWRNKLRTEIIALGSPKVRSYDPATGKQLWELTIGNGRCTASPVGNAEMLFVGLDAGGGGPMGRGQRGEDAGGEDSASGMFAVSAGATGDLDSRDGDAATGGVVWNSRQNGPTTASPLLYDGYIYIVKRDGGILTCLDAETGEQVYRKRIPGAKAFWSSPWAAEGKVYFADDAGTTFVIKSGPEFEVLGQNEIDEMVWASPAAADGAIFLRGVDHLYCIGE
ncbi:MAG: PQQ-binding-like beta-propeller repeat protein, partial [Planctomycetales bacterium]|nr:PQQ-binding-like beta-propeller repeat protein [Planctomycetales bacterium]